MMIHNCIKYCSNFIFLPKIKKANKTLAKLFNKFQLKFDLFAFHM